MKTAMNPATKAFRPILLCLLLALSGCFSLSRGAPGQQHYVLGAEGAAEGLALARQAAPEATVGLRPPRLAEYLTSPFIVVRQGAHRIGFSEFDRWGEDLARGINRTLVAHIAARSPANRVESAPWPPGAQPEYLIQLHVLRFEGVAPEDPLAPQGEAHLLATWEILRSRDGAALAQGTTEVRSRGWAVGDFDALVGLLDAGLATLAEDLVLGLERVLSLADAPPPPYEGVPTIPRISLLRAIPPLGYSHEASPWNEARLCRLVQLRANARAMREPDGSTTGGIP